MALQCHSQELPTTSTPSVPRSISRQIYLTVANNRSEQIRSARDLNRLTRVESCSIIDLSRRVCRREGEKSPAEMTKSSPVANFCSFFLEKGSANAIT